MEGKVNNEPFSDDPVTPTQASTTGEVKVEAGPSDNFFSAGGCASTQKATAPQVTNNLSKQSHRPPERLPQIRQGRNEATISHASHTS